MSAIDSEPFVVDKNLGEKLQLNPNDMPRTNADGEPVVDPTQEQKYLFDTRGCLLIPGVLFAKEAEEMRNYVLRVRDEPESLPEHERNYVSGPLEKLADHPVVVGFLNEFLAHPHLSSAESYGFRMEGSGLRSPSWEEGKQGHFGPHNGSGLMRLPGDTHLYNCYPGKAHSGLTCIVWELNPVEAGDGGTLFVSGSHKSTFSAPASLQQPDSQLWHTYACPAGSLLIFSEATTHSGRPWTNESRDRVPIFSRYNSICSKWHRWEPHPELLASMPPKRQTLFRPVYCEGNVI